MSRYLRRHCKNFQPWQRELPNMDFRTGYVRVTPSTPMKVNPVKTLIRRRRVVHKCIFNKYKD